jgi:two-component system, cell cycle response regulator DivK
MNKKALIIEDNEQNMYMLSYLLRDSGYDVIQSFNGFEGIELAEKNMPDVIFLDIQLPGIDGYQVASEIRKHEKLRGIPIIAVTSYAMPGDEEKALESGATGYVEKPIDPETFMTQIEKYLK